MTKHELPQLKDVGDLRGKRVLLRAALDVPIEDGAVTNTFRLNSVMSTINFLVHQGAKVILMGHIGRDPEETLLPVYRHFLKMFDITFTYDIAGEETKECIEKMKDGQVVLLENLRQDPGERANDAEFAKALADLGDIYVTNAFSVAHRAHASIVGVPKHLPSYAGLNFTHEYEELSKAMRPLTPSLFMLGGAKFDTKLPLVEKYVELYDHVFVGGALANDFFKAMGFEVGASLVSEVDLSDSPLLNNKKILLPIDVIVQKGDEAYVTSPDDVAPAEIILDAGPETVAMLAPFIEEAKTILWNGPLGNYEGGYDEATLDVARKVAAGSAYSIIGGGDTVTALEDLDLQDRVSFISTAGGAMLAFLSAGTLPGIDALMSE